ncbi:MAG: DUF58 domain-containing protein [Victivallaceae bacterium]|nr:DUF58 domain-containing protein [Victivallaceae bacterium]
MNASARIGDCLSVEELARLPDLSFQARYLADGMLQGIHASMQRGCSIEFKEHRKYTLGDRIQDIDWKVYARFDRMHVRIHEVDANLNTFFLLDNSESMMYRNPEAAIAKINYARALAAAMLLLLYRQKDAAALLLLEEEISGSLRPSASLRSHENMLNLLLTAGAPPALTENNVPRMPGRVARWDRTEPLFAEKIPSRSIVVLLSDFYLRPEELKLLLSPLREKQCEVLFFHIFDQQERDLFPGGNTKFQEAETGAKRMVNVDLIGEDYRRLFREHMAALAQLARSLGGESISFCTNEPPLSAFGAWLKARQRYGRRR